MEFYLGMILPWPVPTFAPVDWMYCRGQQLSIQNYTALYSLIGITYGGDAKTYFNLPDLRGRVIVGVNQSPINSAYTAYTAGLVGGAETRNIQATGTATLTASNLPQHTHGLTNARASIPQTNINTSMIVSTDNGANSMAAQDQYFAAPTLGGADPVDLYRSDATHNVGVKGITATFPATLAPLTGNTDAAGQATPAPVGFSVGATVDVRQPYIAMDFIICVNGLYPQRP